MNINLLGAQIYFQSAVICTHYILLVHIGCTFIGQIMCLQIIVILMFANIYVFLDCKIRVRETYIFLDCNGKEFQIQWRIYLQIVLRL